MRDRARVLVTGLGAMTPVGIGVAATWEALVAGRSGVARIQSFDPEGYTCTVGAEIHDFEPRDHMDRKAARRMARFSQLAVAAGAEALTDAGLDLSTEDTTRVGVVIGNGNGGFPDLQAGVDVLRARGGMRLDPLFVPRILPNMAASNMTMQFGIRGYSTTVVTACAAGTQAIGEGAELIRRGVADIVLAGGSEAGFCELGLGGFAVMRALTTRNDDPTAASRPFDADRDGFVPAEGGAVLVLESEAHARAREARVYAEVAGFAATADAHHLVAPDASGDGATRCIQAALADAGLVPDAIDYINAHGTSTPLNDASESRAIRQALGDAADAIPISSTKSMIGHALGGAGALESVAAIKTIETGVIHPTINLHTPDPECDLDYVPNTAREATVRTVLKNSFGFGGQNACLVFAAVD